MYVPRSLHFRAVHAVGNWQLKWYDLVLPGSGPLDALYEAADVVVASDIASRTPMAGDTGLGFVILHRGEEATWLILDTWSGDILTHRLWRADLDGQPIFSRIGADGPSICVHEMIVQNYERNSFVRHMLRLNAGPIQSAYLHDICNGDPAHREQALQRFHEAWHAGDVEACMAQLSESPKYVTSAGPEPGTTYEGRASVAHGIRSVIEAEAAHLPLGGRAPVVVEAVASPEDETWVTKWFYADENSRGELIEVRGVDVWTFDGDQISSKDAYRKSE